MLEVCILFFRTFVIKRRRMERIFGGYINVIGGVNLGDFLSIRIESD